MLFIHVLPAGKKRLIKLPLQNIDIYIYIHIGGLGTRVKNILDQKFILNKIYAKSNIDQVLQYRRLITRCFVIRFSSRVET